MWTFIWIAIAAGTIAFGYYIMKKVDRFLAGSHLSREMAPGSDSLCIGLSNPMTVDGIAEILDRFGRRYPGVPVRLFHDEDETLVKALIRDKLDVVFVSEHTEFPSGEGVASRTVSMEVLPIDTKYNGLPIEPISSGTLRLKVLWRRMEPVPATRYFVECLQIVCEDQWKNQKQVL